MIQQKFCCRGDVSDYVLMEGRGFGFVTFQDPTHAQSFLEVRDISRVVELQAASLLQHSCWCGKAVAFWFWSSTPTFATACRHGNT